MTDHHHTPTSNIKGLDPIVWMYAAVEAVAKGDAGEIEGVWDLEDDAGLTTTIRLTVRKEVQHISVVGDG